MTVLPKETSSIRSKWSSSHFKLRRIWSGKEVSAVNKLENCEDSRVISDAFHMSHVALYFPNVSKKRREDSTSRLAHCFDGQLRIHQLEYSSQVQLMKRSITTYTDCKMKKHSVARITVKRFSTSTKICPKSEVT